jgi:hypothetical protein
MSTEITYAVLKPLILQPKLTMITTASIQECLVYRHIILTILVVMMTVTTTRNQPKTSTTMQWKVPIDDSDWEKFTCRCVCVQRTKRNAKRLHNCRKRAAVRKELIDNTPFAEDTGEGFVPFSENDIINKEPDTVEDNKIGILSY